MIATFQKLVMLLPPFSLLRLSLVERLKGKRLILLHFLTLGTLYGFVFVVAAHEHVLHLHSGIGIFQNPPFWAHLICGLISVGLPLSIAKRIIAAAGLGTDKDVVAELLTLLQNSKTKVVLFVIIFIIGLAALANTVVLSAAVKINIYDSIHHPLTFSFYLLLRIYLYLFCYPFMFCGTVILVYYLFRVLQSNVTSFRPFHEDEMGGLRKYFRAVDRPVYLIQSLTVLVSVMNFIGWGGITAAPLMFRVATPVIVSGFAFLLLFDFHRVLKFKKKQEIRAIRRQQMEIYPEAKRLAALSPADGLELLRRIEAMNALIETIRKGREGGWGKYVVNFAVAIGGQIAKPLGVFVANHLRLT